MPGFRMHTTINLTALTALGASGLWVGAFAPELVVIGAASFLLATVFLSPDLDLRHSSPTKNWGPLRWLWRPYQWCFKHRGLSHSLLLSSATRILYLVAIFVAGCALAKWSITDSIGSDELWAHRTQLGAFGAGVFLSDALHIAADRLTTALKALIGF